MASYCVLLLGIASIAGPVGYMVGGSATPVVAVALPALFGIAATAVGLLQPRLGLKEKAELLAALRDTPGALEQLARWKTPASAVHMRMGLALLVFGVSYLSGSIIGTTARTRGWFAPPIPVRRADFPWTPDGTGELSQPSTIEEALTWITLQHRLLDMGYRKDDVVALYRIQCAQHARETAAAGKPADPGQAVRPSRALEEYLPSSPPRYEPFTHPKKEEGDGHEIK